jgi:hypothetical protein
MIIPKNAFNVMSTEPTTTSAKNLLFFVSLYFSVLARTSRRAKFKLILSLTKTTEGAGVEQLI